MRTLICNQIKSAAIRLTGAVLLIGLVLGLDAFAVSSTLHLKLCPDANRAGHHCAVQSFAGGVVGSSVEALLVLGILSVVVGALHLQAAPLPAVPLFRLSPCRAPPSKATLPG